ncbi:hypothetical protein TD95_003846 [Thielaviopsis punctulata]|uniref:Endothelin-converting enzyme 1 n=1 Tax=Thielaviopsis punctulata TaxID=72032 RepID=A0A0F4ZGZ9_9PEZI|nr:hypothetical protein TD95_003846 [Thielaviopsis punctulata]
MGRAEVNPLLPATGPATPATDAQPRSLLSKIRRRPELMGLGLLVGFQLFRAYEGAQITQSEASVQYANASTGVCMTPACVHIASEILTNLSPDYKDLDPCTDFEEMVCGGWRLHHDLRSDQGDAFTGTIMAENSLMLLRHILEAPYPKKMSLSSDDEANFDKMKSAYTACTDETGIKKSGVEPLKALLKKVDATSSLKDAIELLHKNGIDGLVSIGTGADDTNPDSVVVGVGAPWSLGLPSKERFEDDKLVSEYREVVTKVLGALYPKTDKEVFSKLVDLEKQIAAATPSMQQREDVTYTYNPISLKDATKIAPEVDIEGLVKAFAPKDVEVDRVILQAPDYFKTLSGILADTPKEVLQAYFEWRVVRSYFDMVDDDSIKPLKRFNNELAGKDPESSPERWMTCVRHVDDGLGWILSRFFVETAFSAAAKEFGDQIVTDIKEQFTKKLQAAKWMDDSTTELAIEKVHNIVQKIGYPTASPDITNPGALADYYASVKVGKHSYFDNEVSMRELAVKRQWAALGKPVDREEWGMTVPTVNAYYNPPGNEIVFPAGIMQFPVFDVNAPAYVSYGAFGSVAGHELSHAFDSTGRHYDQNGNYTDWWTEETVEAFTDKAQCFIDQYSKYTVPGPREGEELHVNGRLTLGENIADAGGLSASFQAWKQYDAATGKGGQDLPGLDYFSHEQLFFVAYSNWWCGKSRKNAAISKIYTDPHAPKWARVLGTMANSREFRESFNCPVKEPTCELW